VREQQQEQADEDVGGAGDAGKRAGHEVVVQPVLQVGLEDGGDVRQADQRGEQRRGPGNPDMVAPAVSETRGFGATAVLRGPVGTVRVPGILRGLVGTAAVSSFFAVAHFGSSLVRP
jgi:hypothetical protein